MEVCLRSLLGSSQTVTLRREATARELDAVLKGMGQNHRLFYKGRALEKDAPLLPLVQEGSFVTLLPKSKPTGKKGAQTHRPAAAICKPQGHSTTSSPHDAAELGGGFCPEPHQPHPSLSPATGGQTAALDSLLPGHILRPQPSPAKKQPAQVSLTWHPQPDTQPEQQVQQPLQLNQQAHSGTSQGQEQARRQDEGGHVTLQPASVLRELELELAGLQQQSQQPQQTQQQQHQRQQQPARRQYCQRQCPQQGQPQHEHQRGPQQHHTQQLQSARHGQLQSGAAVGGRPSQFTALSPVQRAKALDAAVTALPLPPCMEQLMVACGVLAAVHKFVLSKHVQPTWLMLQAALPQQHTVQLPDLLLLSALAPGVINLRDSTLSTHSHSLSNSYYNRSSHPSSSPLSHPAHAPPNTHPSSSVDAHLPQGGKFCLDEACAAGQGASSPAAAASPRATHALATTALQVTAGAGSLHGGPQHAHTPATTAAYSVGGSSTIPSCAVGEIGDPSSIFLELTDPGRWSWYPPAHEQWSEPSLPAEQSTKLSSSLETHTEPQSPAKPAKDLSSSLETRTKPSPQAKPARDLSSSLATRTKPSTPAEVFSELRTEPSLPAELIIAPSLLSTHHADAHSLDTTSTPFSAADPPPSSAPQGDTTALSSYPAAGQATKNTPTNPPSTAAFALIRMLSARTTGALGNSMVARVVWAVRKAMVVVVAGFEEQWVRRQREQEQDNEGQHQQEGQQQQQEKHEHQVQQDDEGHQQQGRQQSQAELHRQENQRQEQQSTGGACVVSDQEETVAWDPGFKTYGLPTITLHEVWQALAQQRTNAQAVITHTTNPTCQLLTNTQHLQTHETAPQPQQISLKGAPRPPRALKHRALAATQGAREVRKEEVPCLAAAQIAAESATDRCTGPLAAEPSGPSTADVVPAAAANEHAGAAAAATAAAAAKEHAGQEAAWAMTATSSAPAGAPDAWNGSLQASKAALLTASKASKADAPITAVAQHSKQAFASNSDPASSSRQQTDAPATTAPNNRRKAKAARDGASQDPSRHRAPAKRKRGGKRNDGGDGPLHDYGQRAGGELCRSCKAMGPEQVLEHLQRLPWYCDQMVHTERLPACPARYGTPEPSLSDTAVSALAVCGVSRLYAHQTQAIDAVRRGAHVAVSTSTASGKSLCYNVPMLEALAMDANSCALYCFPTKALAQDQLLSLRALVQAAFGQNAPSVEIYDGDTPQHDRPAIRERAQLLITNPDMLHRSILPFHSHFARLLSNLRLCVVDEGHAFHGVFGAHTAMVIRRLRRLCAGTFCTYPRFVVTSATTANPAQHAARLIGLSDSTADAAAAVADGAGVPERPSCTTAAVTGLEGIEAKQGAAFVAAAVSDAAQINNGWQYDGGMQPWWQGDHDGKEQELVLVTEDGSPSPGKIFALWNPPLKVSGLAQITQPSKAQGSTQRKQKTAPSPQELMGHGATEASSTPPSSTAGLQAPSPPCDPSTKRSTYSAAQPSSQAPLSVPAPPKGRAARTAARHMLREANAARCRGTRLGGQQVQQVHQQDQLVQQVQPSFSSVLEADSHFPLPQGAAVASGAGAGAEEGGEDNSGVRRCGGAGNEQLGHQNHHHHQQQQQQQKETLQHRQPQQPPQQMHQQDQLVQHEPEQLPQPQQQQVLWEAEVGLGVSAVSLRRRVFGSPLKGHLHSSPSTRLGAQLVASLPPSPVKACQSGQQPKSLSPVQACLPIEQSAQLNQQQLTDQAPKKQRPNSPRTKRKEQRLLQDALAALSSVGTLTRSQQHWCKQTGPMQGSFSFQRPSYGTASRHPSCDAPFQHHPLHAAPLHAHAHAPSTSGPPPHQHLCQQQEQQLDVRPAIHLKQPGLIMPSSASTTAATMAVLPDTLPTAAPGMTSNRHDLPPHAVAASKASSTGAQTPVYTPTTGTTSTADSTEALAPACVAARFPPSGEWKAQYGAAGTPEDERRDSPLVETALLLAEMMQHGLKTIAFCKTRKLSELVSAYARETLTVTAPHLAERLKVYRGGYSPEDRRAVEAGLHSGELLAVTATNALELGIDVGALDATLHLGFPGSIASLKQQAGRAGRRGCPSLSILVSFDSPLDQHFMRHPDELFGRPIEYAQVDVSNSRVLASHLVCAAAEMPLDCSAAFAQPIQQHTVSGVRDAELFGATSLRAATQDLMRMGLIGRHPHYTSIQGASLLHYTGLKDLPAADVSLRAIEDQGIDIVLEGTRQVIERIELSKAFFQVYDGAVMLWQGKKYLCKLLDLTSMVAVVKPADVAYYTKVRDYTDIHVTGGRLAYPATAAASFPLPVPNTLAQASVAAAEPTSHKSPEADALAAALHPVGSAPTAEQAAQEITAPTAQSPGGMGPRLALVSASLSAAEQAASKLAVSISAAAPAALTAICEQAVVTVRFLGFFRVWQGSGRVFDSVDLWLPDIRFHTQAAYLRVPAVARHKCLERGLDFRAALHAASHAVLHVLPALMSVDPKDVGTECDNPYDTRYRPERIIIYDKQPGGIGIAQMASSLFPQLLHRALALVNDCPCAGAKGCPSCCQHLHCRNYNVVLDKQGAAVVLEAICGHAERHL